MTTLRRADAVRNCELFNYSSFLFSDLLFHIFNGGFILVASFSLVLFLLNSSNLKSTGTAVPSLLDYGFTLHLY